MAGDKDTRTYVRIHDGMPDHPKVDGLSDAAFRLLVTMWCWCSRHLTDGVVPSATWMKRGREKVRAELIAAGLVDLRDDGSVFMHDYTDHQRTAEEVRQLQQARREAGRKGGLAKANGLASAIANAKQNGSKPVAETETYTDIEPPTPLDAKRGARAYGYDADSKFGEFWHAYPIKKGKPNAFKAWQAALARGADPDVIIKAAQRYRDDPQRNPQMSKYPQGWLSDERYNDQPELPVSAGGWWDN